MTQDSSPVKGWFQRKILDPLLVWAECHPKVALWLIFVAHLNLLLNIIGVWPH